MRKLVKFKALTDIIVGGVRIDDNFLISEQYLSGSVIRAGFVNDILLNCPNSNIIGKSQKLNYIELKSDKCNSCTNKSICDNFSNMRFSFFYPNSSFPAPLTTKVCKKYGAKHSIKDIIFCNGSLKCNECNTGLKRMENLKGYISKSKNNHYNEIKLRLIRSTHTAIDYNSHTALEGSLFTLESIPQDTIFEGYIDDLNLNLICEGKIIYVGKYSSNGFGKLKIVDILDLNIHDIYNKIDSFNKKISNLKISLKDNTAISLYDEILNSSDNTKFATIYLKSDAKLDFLPKDNAIQTLEEYNNVWTNKLFNDFKLLKLEKIFAQNSLYGGFDTSKKYGSWKNNPDIITLKGSSFLISYKQDVENLVLEYLEKISNFGIGKDTLNGYGQIEICNEIHSLGVC